MNGKRNESHGSVIGTTTSYYGQHRIGSWTEKFIVMGPVGPGTKTNVLAKASSNLPEIETDSWTKSLLVWIPFPVLSHKSPHCMKA
jgi:hypothetical protein